MCFSYFHVAVQKFDSKVSNLLITKVKYDFAKLPNSLAREILRISQTPTSPEDALIEPRDTRFRIINIYVRFTDGLIIAEVQTYAARFVSSEGR